MNPTQQLLFTLNPWAVKILGSWAVCHSETFWCCSFAYAVSDGEESGLLSLTKEEEEPCWLLVYHSLPKQQTRQEHICILSNNILVIVTRFVNLSKHRKGNWSIIELFLNWFLSCLSFESIIIFRAENFRDAQITFWDFTRNLVSYVDGGLMA